MADMKETYTLMFTDYPDIVNLVQMRKMLGGSVHRAVQRGRYGFAVLVPSALVRCAALVGARRVLRCRRVVRHRRLGNEYPQVYGCITTA